MDLKSLQHVVDDLNLVVLKLEQMGFSPDSLDGLPEALKSIKAAGADARLFRKNVLISIFVVGGLLGTAAAYYAINWTLNNRILQIDDNRQALKNLDDAGVGIQVEPTKNKAGDDQLAIKFNRPFNLRDGVVYLSR